MGQLLLGLSCSRSLTSLIGASALQQRRYSLRIGDDDAGQHSEAVVEGDRISSLGQRKVIHCNSLVTGQSRRQGQGDIITSLGSVSRERQRHHRARWPSRRGRAVPSSLTVIVVREGECSEGEND